MYILLMREQKDILFINNTNYDNTLSKALSMRTLSQKMY